MMNNVVMAPCLDNNDEVKTFIEYLVDNCKNEIHLLCDGPGGDLENLLKILFYINFYKIKLVTYIASSASSANSMLFCLGAKRNMAKHSLFHLHAIQMQVDIDISNVKLFKMLGSNNNVLSKILKDIDPKLVKYVNNSKENYFTYEDCRKNGICTNVFNLV